jgi:hypothetical protein
MLRLGVSQEEGADGHDADEINNATLTVMSACPIKQPMKSIIYRSYTSYLSTS